MRNEWRVAEAQQRSVDLDELLNRKAAFDQTLYADFCRRHDAAPQKFTALSVGRRRAYLNLWNRSDFLVRRQFYSSVRALVMIAAYSMDEVWAAIGYQGPLLPRSRRQQAH